MRAFLRFVGISLHLVVRGGAPYYAWIAGLVAVIALGVDAYLDQLAHGLIRTSMRDEVSWAFYIGNFTFLVGVAAAAVILVIPAYVYDWKPIKEIAIVGELLAISAIVMCLLFVTVDIGHPERFWHLIPFVGRLNLPSSLLAWDVLVLNAYLGLNLLIVTHLLFQTFRGRHHSPWIIPFILASIPMAVSIHSVTAFVYNGMPARPYWNSAILAPRFIASAFCSGPAVMLIVLQVLRRYRVFEIKDEAIWKIAELMAYAMFVNLFLTGAEIFKEFYSSTEHVVHTTYLWRGLHGTSPLAPYAWGSLALAVASFLLFLVPRTRTNPITLNLGAVMIFGSVYVEKGIALVVPGFTPSTLGQIYPYTPSRTEVTVAAGIFAIGVLVFTLMLKVASPIMNGEFSVAGLTRRPRETTE